MTSAYTRQVESRNAVMELDEFTSSSLARVARWLVSGKARPMLLLYGGVGNGKTTMAKAIASLLSTLQSGIEDRVRKGTFGLSEEETKTLYELQRTLRPARMLTAQDIASLASKDQEQFESVSRSPFLIIDDLGCEPVTVRNYGTEVTPVTDILYKRYDGMMPTVVTTNLTKKDIRSVYGDRVADRFKEVFETIGYTGHSYRK